MEKPKKRMITVYLDQELADWLDARAQEGYKKASLVRHVLAAYARGGEGHVA